MAKNGESAVQVVYKDPHKHEYFVITEPGMVEKWREDKSIPIQLVLQTYQVFQTLNDSHQGRCAHPSKQVLANSFDTEDDDQIIRTILEKGQIQRYSAPVALNGRI